MRVRPEDIVSALSDSTETRTVGSGSAECNSAERTDCKSLFRLGSVNDITLRD
jgi:hypothetical protein